MLRQTICETAAGVTVTATLEPTTRGNRCLRLEHDTTTIEYQLAASPTGAALEFQARYDNGQLTAASQGDTTQPDWATAVIGQFGVQEVPQ